MRSRLVLVLLTIIFLSACAGLERSCSSWGATQFGGNWLVAQYRFDGTPFNCWKLVNVSIANESASDGIYWKDSSTSHLVHISGWYNRVQVPGNVYQSPNFDEASKLVGVNVHQCGNGKYPVQ